MKGDKKSREDLARNRRLTDDQGKHRGKANSKSSRLRVSKTVNSVAQIPIQIPGSKLVVAMVQLEGPLPSGKTLVASSGRETYEWKSLNEIDRRIAKAVRILDFLHEQHPDTNIVVFPEYSLPLVDAVPVLHEKSRLYNQIIVAGADNMRQARSRKIFNKCAVLVPDRTEPIWITKRHLSQWEQPYLDEPQEVSNPVLRWEASGQTYLIAIYICLDFTFAIRDPLDTVDNSVIYLVPMCSPENHTFRAHADAILGEKENRAVLLSNCLPPAGAGASSLFAVTPGGSRLRPAYELPPSRECFAVLELDCSHLTLPRRTTKETKSCLKTVNVYSLDTTPAGTEISPFGFPPPGRPSARAVINPALFSLYGKTMRVTFVGVNQYGTLSESAFANQGFECYSVLGHNDVMVTHLDQSASAMFIDMSSVIPWRLPTGQSMNPQMPIEDGDVKGFPFFEVTTFHKVLGKKVDATARRTFSASVPTADELSQILALGKDWYDPNVADDDRVKFRERKWLLGNTSMMPGEINAVMTIYLDNPDEILRPLQDFEDRILPKLVENSAITSIYEGTGHRIQIHFLLRITSSVESLFSLIQDVHALAAQARLIIKTNTYVIVKKWSDLALEKNLLLAELSPSDEQYRASHIMPKLSPEDKKQLVNLPIEHQLTLIGNYRELEANISTVADRSWLKPYLKSIHKELLVGLLTQDFAGMRRPHDMLQSRVESLLRTRIDEHVPQQVFEAIENRLGIRGNKQQSDLTYTERIKVAIQASKEGLVEPSMLDDLNDLFEKTVQVRNAIVHDDWGKITIQAYVRAISVYCRFLLQWDVTED